MMSVISGHGLLTFESHIYVRYIHTLKTLVTHNSANALLFNKFDLCDAHAGAHMLRVSGGVDHSGPTF